VEKWLAAAVAKPGRGTDPAMDSALLGIRDQGINIP